MNDGYELESELDIVFMMLGVFTSDYITSENSTISYIWIFYLEFRPLTYLYTSIKHHMANFSARNRNS